MSELSSISIVPNPTTVHQEQGDLGVANGALGPQASLVGLRIVVEDIVAHVFHIEPALLRLPTRGRANVALARQVAMYIAHVGYGLNLTDVGIVFERDRTTVAHACSLVEMRRENREFDGAILLIESITRAIKGPQDSGSGPSAKWARTSGADVPSIQAQTSPGIHSIAGARAAHGS